MFVSCAVYDIVQEKYDYKAARWLGYVPNTDTVWYPEHTYFVVFSIGQKNAEEAFNKLKGFKILYKSPMAYNTVHPGEPRNTLYIFEVDETLPLRTVPEVS